MNSFENSQYNPALFYDLRKAFDCASHDTDSIIQLIKCHLTDRRQVVISGILSSSERVMQQYWCPSGICSGANTFYDIYQRYPSE